eukprot:2417010-Prymnesium_polylepis.1
MSFVEAPQAFCYDVMLTEILPKLQRLTLRRCTDHEPFPGRHTASGAGNAALTCLNGAVTRGHVTRCLSQAVTRNAASQSRSPAVPLPATTRTA